MAVKCEISEWVEGKNGECGYFKHYTEYREFTEEGKRHNLLCVACGFPGYPECTKTCQHANGKTIKKKIVLDEEL